MGWSFTLDGETFTEEGFDPFGYAQEFPRAMAALARVAQQFDAEAGTRLSFGAAQTLTNTQQQTALNNIGASSRLLRADVDQALSSTGLLRARKNLAIPTYEAAGDIVLLDNARWLINQDNFPSTVTAGTGGFSSGGLPRDCWRINGGDGTSTTFNADDGSVSLFRSSGSGRVTLYQKVRTDRWRPAYAVSQRFVAQIDVAVVGAPTSLVIEIATYNNEITSTGETVIQTLTIPVSGASSTFTTKSFAFDIPALSTALGMRFSAYINSSDASNYWRMRAPVLRSVVHGGEDPIPAPVRTPSVDRLIAEGLYQRAVGCGFNGFVTPSGRTIVAANLRTPMRAGPTPSLSKTTWTTSDISVGSSGVNGTGITIADVVYSGPEGVCVSLTGWSGLTPGLPVTFTSGEFLNLDSRP